ncbi:hypothetical protein J3R30DRAFT_3423062 [Lentinula aciculospora]|uniref:F-box domain-containing protein n=1 Tax=Lentinula aciculospora TaxID=153920 RepID=A0A9W9AU25_9AGAR|nr:hypothetical protein J3R30DRAFT_3423062 [Lentinula aciculospora]
MSDLNSSLHDDAIFISRLSPEILGHIFAIYCQSQKLLITKHAPQLIITQISSLWRAITQQTPDVWTTLSVTLTNIDDTDALREWLTRAKSLPLDITVRQRDQTFHPNNLACLTSFTLSCRSLDLSLPWDSWMQPPSKRALNFLI